MAATGWTKAQIKAAERKKLLPMQRGDQQQSHQGQHFEKAVHMLLGRRDLFVARGRLLGTGRIEYEVFRLA